MRSAVATVTILFIFISSPRLKEKQTIFRKFCRNLATKNLNTRFLLNILLKITQTRLKITKKSIINLTIIYMRGYIFITICIPSNKEFSRQKNPITIQHPPPLIRRTIELALFIFVSSPYSDENKQCFENSAEIGQRRALTPGPSDFPAKNGIKRVKQKLCLLEIKRAPTY